MVLTSNRNPSAQSTFDYNPIKIQNYYVKKPVIFYIRGASRK